MHRACRLAEKRHELIANPEVKLALEQELLHALVNCLTAGEANAHPETRRHHAGIMVRFEQALAAHAGDYPNISALCAQLGVPQRTLRACCAEFLGLSPARYVLLRRLNMARAALLCAHPATASIARIAHSCQFREPGRFAVTYRAVFGEMPSATLRRPAKSPDREISAEVA